MPLNKEALPLEPAPSAVAAARRWVLGLCRDLGRDDLVDCAELGVSELVTNAILHGEAPINVRLRGTRAHPRIEVFDSSPRPPVLGDPPLDAEDDDDLDELDEFLTTFGRGLSMVSMASVAWGASIEHDGKIVWFEPAPAMSDEAYREGVIDIRHDAQHEWRPAAESVKVRLERVDLKLFLSVLTQYNNLRRELRLLALAHEADYPLARDLSHMFSTFERQFPPAMLEDVANTLRSGGRHADLVFRAAPESSQIFTTMLEMFDLADAFCRAQRLLSLARSPEQRALQVWLLDQFLRQVAGEEPTPWHADEHEVRASTHVS